MSIIEKAVTKLESESGAEKETAPAKVQVDTVQKLAARDEVEAERALKPTDRPVSRFEPTVEKPLDAEVEGDSGSPVTAGGMVNIPFERLQENGMVTPAVPRNRVAEEFRTIKRPLLQNITGDFTDQLR